MWTNAWTLLPTIILLWPLRGHAANFTFSYGPATECDDFEVSWSGGTPPFQLTLVPPYGTPRTFDIPSDKFNNGKGSFSTPLPLASGNHSLAVMSDSTGFASGGVSPLFAVGDSVGHKSCNTTDPGVDFLYETNLALAQCRLYTFSGYNKGLSTAVQPVTILGLVPGGSSFVLNAPVGPTFDWVADVSAGTSLIFVMTDSKGRQGGATQVNLVGMSDDSSCLNNNSPASVTNAPSETSTGGSKPTATTSNGGSPTSAPDSAPANKSDGGTVAAAVIGCLVAAFVVGTLIWFLLRRRRGGAVLKGRLFGGFQKQEVDLMHDPGLPPPASVSPYPLYQPHTGPRTDGVASTPNSTADLLGRGRPSGDAFSAAYTPTTAAFARPSTADSQTQLPPPGIHRGSLHDGSAHGSSAGGRPDEGSVASWDQTVTSGMRRKAAAAGISPYAPSTRFILHTDLEDDLPPPPPDDEVIELPPQYSERRAPPHPGAGPSAPTAGPSVPGSGPGYPSHPS